MQTLSVTTEAREIIKRLEQEHGSLVFLISGGCCDGSAPLCFPANEFSLGTSDVILGQAASHPVYVSEHLSEYYSAPEDFVLDVAAGRGGGFSLEAPFGVRFINRAK